MRELTENELEQISGGLSWTEGGLTILTLSAVSPVTFAFGAPIAAGMLTVAHFTDQ